MELTRKKLVRYARECEVDFVTENGSETESSERVLVVWFVRQVLAAVSIDVETVASALAKIYQNKPLNELEKSRIKNLPNDFLDSVIDDIRSEW